MFHFLRVLVIDFVISEGLSFDAAFTAVASQGLHHDTTATIATLATIASIAIIAILASIARIARIATITAVLKKCRKL